MKISPFPRDQGLVSWFIRKVVDHLPAVLVSKAVDAIDALADPKTPAVKRAILVAVVLELIGLVKISRPLAIILRFTIIQDSRLNNHHQASGSPAERLLHL